MSLSLSSSDMPWNLAIALSSSALTLVVSSCYPLTHGIQLYAMVGDPPFLPAPPWLPLGRAILRRASRARHCCLSWPPYTFKRRRIDLRLRPRPPWYHGR